MKRQPNGWTPERRARQAAAIRRWRPWRRSTGPKTEAGKARVAMNALRHGQRSRAWIIKAKRIRHAIRLCADTVLLARIWMREQERLAVLRRLQRAGAPPSAAGSPFTAIFDAARQHAPHDVPAEVRSTMAEASCAR